MLGPGLPELRRRISSGELYAAGDRKEIYSYTIIEPPAWHPNFPTPIVIAIVGVLCEERWDELETTEIVDVDREWNEELNKWEYPDLRLGMRVEKITRKIRSDVAVPNSDRGAVMYGPKYRPVFRGNE